MAQHLRDRHFLLVLVLASLVTLPLGLLADDGHTAGNGKAAFEKLKMLEGTWNDPSAKEENPQIHVFEVSAGGTVIQETMAVGTDHEMINMYHLDGDDLMLTHYCAGGNQPRMKMVAGDLAKAITFEFVDGTNLDPAKDGHIHEGKIVFVDDDSIESHWMAYNEGKPAGEMTFELTRTSE